jgi:hypothetical protein
MIRVRNIRIQGFFLLIAGAFFFIGCAPEKKIGSEFLSKRNGITMVIRAPDWVKMENLSPDTINYPFSPIQRERDSIKYYNSKILQDLTDSVLISTYVRNLQESLISQGFKTLIVFKKDTIFPVKQNAFLINIGQIEVDEKSIPIRDETQYNRKLYGADYDQAKVEMSFWVEICKIEDSIAIEPTRLLFDSYEITDQAEGAFQWDYANNRMNYVLKQDEILPTDVYNMAKLMGADHGLRLNDYLLNEYIFNFLPQMKDKEVFTLDRRFGTVIRTDEPPFQEIHE